MRKEKYIVFRDKRFDKYSKNEIAKALDDASIIHEEDKFMVIETSSSSNKTKKLANDSTFIDNIIPLLGTFDYHHGFGVATKAISDSLKKPDRFVIEAFNTNSKTGLNAKSIEVKMGNELESLGFIADLKNPNVCFYVIFSGDSVYLGRLSDRRVLDAFRVSNKGVSEVSRAEFKLKEALEYFGVDQKRIKMAIDIGASPGGWSRVISGLGAKVIAIDTAELKFKSDLVTHIRERADTIDEKRISELDKADLLLIDTNTDPGTSSSIAAKFAGTLKTGGALILTIKFVGGSLDKHMALVRERLSADYTGIRMKKLPHNRLEVTCFAIRR